MRWHRLIAVGAAWPSLLLGLVVIAAWHLHITAIIQVLPGSPPIRYNTALAFTLSGLALLLLQRQQRQLWALISSGLVLAIGGLTLWQYLFKVDLGIDQLFMQDYLTNQMSTSGQLAKHGITEPIQQFFVTIDRPLPGRPSPNTALAFSLVGIALLGFGWPQQHRHRVGLARAADTTALLERGRSPQGIALGGILASGIFAIGLITLLGYGAQLTTVYAWRYLTGISIPTAAGLLGLGLGLMSHALGYGSTKELPRWFPLSLGFGVLMASLFLSEALLSWNHNLGQQIPELAQNIEALLRPVATIVLLQGIMLALLVMGVLYFDQWLKAQANNLKQLNEQLADAHSVLRATLESTADGILVLGQDWRVLHCNRQFIQLWRIPEALVNAVERDGGEPNFHAFFLSQVKDPDAFNALSQRMMSDLESKTFDVVELKDGRMFERYGRPQWRGDRAVAKVLSYRDVTESHRADVALRDSETRYRSLIAALAEGVGLQDAAGVIQTCNASAEAILGLTLEQLQGRTSIDPRWYSVREDGSPFPGDQHPAMVSLRTGQPCRNVVMGMPKPNGMLTWIVINAQPLMRPGEVQPYAVMTSFADITERKQMEAALFYEKELAQVTLHSIGDAVITTDMAGRIEYFNPIAEALTGWSQPEVKGLPLTSALVIIHEETRVAVPNPVEIALRENRIVELSQNTVLLSRDGREIGIEDSAAPIRDRSGNTVGAVMVFHDVTQARYLTRQVTWQAIHDSLTGLVNRREFEQRLGQALHRAHTYDERHVLCYLDLDQFKIVNDTCGHKAGDELLRQVTTLLQDQIRKTDTLARLGGDEFGILLHQCDLDQALRVANLLRETIQAFRFVWEGNTFAIGVSIGVVPIDRQSRSLDTLLMTADSACYAAKNNGRNRVHVFQPDDQILVQQQGEMRWAARLARALEDNRFCLFAQPIVSTHPDLPAERHYEVLLRLWDETGTLVPPMAFLPAAERYGLMVKIDRWVVSNLFQHWSQIQPPPGRVGDHQPRIYAINLSGATLNDDEMIDFLQQQFVQYAIPYHLVCFEITETVAIANLSKTRQFIHRLRSLGCRFALDDFGSGMSSFAYLKNLPIDYLKIDGGFVKDILEDPVDDAMVDAINRIGQVMGIKTIAEYVENAAILDRITALGVDFAQGYGIARPAPLVGTAIENCRLPQPTGW